MESFACPAPMASELSKEGKCKPYGRLNVRIGDDDELGTFIFRTTGFNSIRTLAARLSYFQAVSGNLLSCMALELKLRGKSTMNSFRSAIYYVDLTVREGKTLEQTLGEAVDMHVQREEAGFNQQALDTAAKAGFANAALEFTKEELPEILEELYPIENPAENEPLAIPVSGKSLKGKLGNRLEAFKESGG